MAGYTYRTGIAEGGPTIQPFIAGAAVAVGDMVMLSSGKVVVATTDSEGVVGAVVSVPEGTIADGTTDILVITDRDAVYGVRDANARKLGDTLDQSGATGAMTVATSSNKDLIVAAASTADQETLVRINGAKHFTMTNDLT